MSNRVKEENTDPFYNIRISLNPITHGGGAIIARIVFNAQFDPEGVKIARWYFMTFPKYA